MGQKSPHIPIYETYVAIEAADVTIRFDYPLFVVKAVQILDAALQSIKQKLV